VSISSGLSIGDLIARNARLYGDRPAFVQGQRRLSHVDYFARCLRLADAIYAAGARRQDRVAILSMNSIEFAEVYGACEVAGFIISTLNFRLAPKELAYILREAAPGILIFEEQYADVVDQLRSEAHSVRAWVCIGAPPPWAAAYEDFLSQGGADGPPIRSREDDVAHLIYTSGTTGRPKGCILGHGESLNKAQFHASDCALTAEDSVLILMPLFHVGARGVESGAQWRGAAVHLERKFTPELFIRTVASERITIGHLAPTMVQEVLEDPLVEQADLSSLRAIFYSSAPMPLPVLRRGLHILGNVFHQSYGQTEGAISSLQRWQHRPDGDARDLRRLTSVGQPYPGVEVRIVDEAGNEAPLNTPGEIVYRGGSAFRGYWNNSVATAEAVRDGWIYSGDIGQLDKDGYLYIVDRKKDMIVSGGENIYSREVEDAIASHEDVAECAVIGVPHARWGETVRAIVVLREGGKATESDIIESCRSRIASYKKPTSVVFCPALPKVNGKINKQEVKALYGGAS